MTQTAPRLDRATVETVLALAVRAPSIHNTQPWRWRLSDDGLRLLADRSRQLQVADPDGHSLLISCGAALHLTELGLAANGWQTVTELWPDSDDADLIARIVPERRTDDVAPDLADKVAAAARRHSDRRPFAMTELTEDEIEALRAAGSESTVWFDFPLQPEQRIDLAVAVSWADRVENQDPEYIAEMQHWLRDPDVHPTADGVPLDAVPHVPADTPRHTDVPMRDFELGVSGRQLIEADVDERPVIAVALTHGDAAADHLLTGHSMMRLMIEAERRGLACCPLSQAVDLAAFRTRVQSLMGWVGYPQIMLRVGHPSGPSNELVTTPRRPVSAVLDRP